MQKIISMVNLGTEEYVYTGTAIFDAPFNISLAGITYPNIQYHMYMCSLSKCWVFEYVVEGKGYIETDNEVLTVEAGDFYVMPAHSVCHYYPDKEKPYKKVWFNLAGGLVEQICKTYNLTSITVVKADVYRYFEDIFDILKKENVDFVKLHLKFHELIAKIGTVSSNDPDNILVKIHNYISENSDKKLNLNVLSEKFFISHTHLIHLFKNKYGKTPYNYYLEVKLEKARELLNNTNLTIKDIASKLSFSDQRYFSKSFYKAYGCTPQDYRKGKNK